MSGSSTWQRSRGSAVVDFAIVVPLVLAVVLAIAQIMFAWYVKVIMTSAAQVGAQAAAISGANLSEVEATVGQRLSGSLAEGLVSDVDVEVMGSGGLGLAKVSVGGRLPILGLLGPKGLQVTGYSVVEHW